MVKKIFLILILTIDFVFAQHNNQSFNSPPLTDSSVQLTSLPWLNYKYIFGRYTNSYGAPQKLKLGSMFTIAGDSVIVTTGGSGDVNQNGNSYGTTMKVGTNDNNTFTLETNNTDRFSLSSGSSTGGIITHNARATNTNTDFDAYTCNLTSTGTVANGFGGGIKFTAPTTTGAIKDQAGMYSYWSQALNGSEESGFKFRGNSYGSFSDFATLSVINGGRLTLSSFPQLVLDPYGLYPSTDFTITPFANNLTLSSSKASSTVAIRLHTTGDGSQTAITRDITASDPISSSILLLSGTYIGNGAGSNTSHALKITNSVNESGGHAGTHYGIQITPGLSGVTNYYALAISSAQGFGVYQSSGNLQNNLAGKTNIGSTGDPVVKLKVTGRFASAKGADVASASSMTLGTDGNSFKITGTTTINKISATDWIAGSIVYLIFNGSITVVHNSGTGTGAPIFLSGSINYAAVNNSVLGLIYDGAVWQEISRKTP